MGMECDSDGEARSSGDFWRWLGGRQQARELELFFFFPPASYWPAPGCELAEVGPLNVSGARPPPDAASPKLGPAGPKKREAHSMAGSSLSFWGTKGTCCCCDREWRVPEGCLCRPGVGVQASTSWHGMASYQRYEVLCTCAARGQYSLESSPRRSPVVCPIRHPSSPKPGRAANGKLLSTKGSAHTHRLCATSRRRRRCGGPLAQKRPPFATLPTPGPGRLLACEI